MSLFNDDKFISYLNSYYSYFIVIYKHGEEIAWVKKSTYAKYGGLVEG